MLNKSLWFSFFAAIFIALLVRTFIFSISYMPAQSMIPTLYPGDYVVLNQWVYRDGLPKRGDVIVYTKEDDPGVFFTKRVLAVGGDVVEVKNGFVIVNQKEADYGSIQSTNVRLEKLPDSAGWHWIDWQKDNRLTIAPYTVREGRYFVVADHRLSTNQEPWDSVPGERIKARVDLILFRINGGFRWDRVLKTVD